MKLSSKHRKTLQAIFDNPVRSDVEWEKIESLFSALGGELSDGRAIGSTIPPTYDIRPGLNKYPIPITIIQGNKDYIDPAAGYWKDIIQSYDSIHLQVIKNASHYSWLDNQEQFNKYLRQAILRTED